MKSTIRDVAAQAGVSLGTVHRTLSGNGYVSTDARQKVLDAAAALAYRPNAIAQSLRRQRTGMIGHLVHSIYPNPFFACVSVGVEERGRELGLATVNCNTHGSVEIETDYVEFLLRQRVTGIIFTVPLSTDNVRRVQDAGISVCIVERPQGMDDVDQVVADNRTGARAAVTHLIELGHRRIGYVGAPPHDDVETDRFRGYHDALAEHDIESFDALVRYTGSNRESGYRGVAELADLAQRPTAVFAAGDLLAAGALQAAWERRLRVPDDLSLVGFDDTLADTAAPPLTTVALPMREMGAAAVDLIAHRAERQAAAPPRRIVLSTRLVVRASTAGPHRFLSERRSQEERPLTTRAGPIVVCDAPSPDQGNPNVMLPW